MPWTQRVTELLTHPTSNNLLPWMQHQVEAGIAQLWLVSDPSDSLYVITRIDDHPREWCIPYVRGSGLLKFGPLFIEVAKRNGLNIRAHVESPAMVRLLAKLSFRYAETVVRLEHGC